MLPNQLAEALHDRLKEMNKGKLGIFNTIIFIESALGLLNFEAICRRAQELMDLGVPLCLDGVVFGSDDYCASIGEKFWRPYGRALVIIIILNTNLFIKPLILTNI